MCFESTHCSTGPQPCSALPGRHHGWALSAATNPDARYGWAGSGGPSGVGGGSRPPGGLSRVRATEETRRGEVGGRASSEG